MIIVLRAVIEDGWCSLEGFLCGLGGRGLLEGSHKYWVGQKVRSVFFRKMALVALSCL